MCVKFTIAYWIDKIKIHILIFFVSYVSVELTVVYKKEMKKNFLISFVLSLQYYAPKK